MPTERDVIESNLAPWLDPKSKGKMRVDSDRDGFTIKYGPLIALFSSLIF